MRKPFAGADIYWEQLVTRGKINISDKSYEEKHRMVNLDEIKLKNAREVGSEWMCFQAIGQLRLMEKLRELGWEEERMRLACTQIISRAVYPFF
mgnify:CR=1 FL=1